MKRVTCSGCSLLCNDIMVGTDGLFIDEIIGTCLKGKEKFDQVSAQNRILSPMIRKNNVLEKVSWDEAIQKTAELLRNSSKSLLYGFSNSTCETHVKAFELAREINGFIDSNSSICQGKVLKSAEDVGITLTTITEIINKTDLIILWGANVAESIPRLLNKTLFTRGKFRMTGREIRTLIIIDPVKTASFNVMGPRDVALFIQPGKDIELIRVLKEECCAADSIPSEGVAGIDADDLKRLLMQLSGAENAVIVIGQGMLNRTSRNDIVKELLELVKMINEKQQKGRISVLMMGGHYNMAGFDQVSLSTVGKIGGIQFKEGSFIDESDTLVSKIEKNDFDLSFIVGTDVISHLPFNLSKKLASNPIIILDNRKSATSEIADIILPTAISGIEASGLAYRLDHVPIELSKILNPPNNIPSDEEIIINILNSIKKLKRGK